LRPEQRPDSMTRFDTSYVCSGLRASRSTSIATCFADSARIRFSCIGAPFRCRGQGVPAPLAHCQWSPTIARSSTSRSADDRHAEVSGPVFP
jgi:hypothetical protein